MLLIRFVRNFNTIIEEERKFVLLLYLWILFSASFIILFSPFMATRHVLLLIVPISLLLAYYAKRPPSTSLATIMIVVTVALTSVLGISDRVWANFYREKAALIRSELPDNANVYFAGHWGWQWYAKLNGMKQLESKNPQIKPGDYLVYPEGIEQQSLEMIPQNLQLKVVREYTAPPPTLNLFSTRGDYASFYFQRVRCPTWVITRSPIPRVEVYRVETAGTYQ